MKKNDRSKIIQLIHIAKSQIGLSDEDYRAVLESTSKKSSCSEMSVFELNEVLKAMKELGFKENQIFTTMEMRMKCGIGKCGRCNIGDKFVCKDGPVFSFDKLGELPPEY